MTASMLELPSLLEMKKEGLEDWDLFEELTTALYMQLGHCAEMLRQQITAIGTDADGRMLNPNSDFRPLF